jgi:hypothetical protein
MQTPVAILGLPFFVAHIKIVVIWVTMYINGYNIVLS